MRLSEHEQSMRAGELGPGTQWAIEHQIKVGTYLGARELVAVSQAHVMADTESLGVSGVEWLEGLAGLPHFPPKARRVVSAEEVSRKIRRSSRKMYQ